MPKYVLPIQGPLIVGSMGSFEPMDSFELLEFNQLLFTEERNQGSELLPC